MSDLFLQNCALYIWLVGDVTLKLFFLILLIHIHYRGQRLPHPHVWILDGIRKMLSCYRTKRYHCFNCKQYGIVHPWEMFVEGQPCHSCAVHKWLLWRKPSNWEAEDVNKE